MINESKFAENANVIVCAYTSAFSNRVSKLEGISVNLRTYNSRNTQKQYQNNGGIICIDKINIGNIEINGKSGLNSCELSYLRSKSFLYEKIVRRREFDLNLPKICNWEIDELSVKIFRYWLNKVENVDFVIFQDVPHSMYDFLCYCACKFKGIGTLVFRTNLCGRTVVMDDLSPDRKFHAQFYKFLEARGLHKLSDTENKEINRLFSTSEIDFDPSYMKRQKMRERVGSLSWFWSRMISEVFNILTLRKRCGNHIFRYFGWRYNDDSLVLGEFSKWQEIHIFRRNYIHKQKLRKKYAKKSRILSKSELSKTKYVYFPLHFQPEATSLPLGGEFVSQEDAIRNLRSQLPDDVLIIVKEHPSQLMGPNISNGSRDVFFYDRLEKIDGIIFSSFQQSSLELIENAFCVATVTGTVALEAVAKSKPAIFYGEPYFKNIPGIYSVHFLEAFGFQGVIRAHSLLKNSVNFREILLKELATSLPTKSPTDDRDASCADVLQFAIDFFVKFRSGSLKYE